MAKIKKEIKTGKKKGRPTIYTEKLGLNICQRVADGESLLSISKDDAMPNRSTIHEWILTNDEFSNKYEKAVNVRTENMADDLNNIADNVKGEVMRDRLRVDTRKWYLSKIVPKKYGDKIDHTTNGQSINLKFDGAFMPTSKTTGDNSE